MNYQSKIICLNCGTLYQRRDGVLSCVSCLQTDQDTVNTGKSVSDPFDDVPECNEADHYRPSVSTFVLFPYAVCVSNCVVGLALIYLNSPLSDYRSARYGLKTLIGYFFNQDNLLIFYQYLFAGFLILTALMIYTKIRNSFLAGFNWKGLFFLKVLFLTIYFFLRFYQIDVCTSFGSAF